MNRAEVRSIRTALEDVISKIKINGYDIQLGSCTFGDVDARFKLVVQVEGESREAADFKRHAFTFGLKPTDLGKELPDGGIIVGLKTRSRKYPILVERNGKRFKYPASTIKMILGS